MIQVLSSAMLSSVLLYMHKVDPSITFLIPIVFFPFSISTSIFLTIFLSAAIIESERYSVPDFVFLLAIISRVASIGIAALIGGAIYAFPAFVFYIFNDKYFDKVFMKKEIVIFFIVGAFFVNLEFLAIFYAIFISMYVPYSFLDRKVLALSIPAFISTYLIYFIKSYIGT